MTSHNLLEVLSAKVLGIEPDADDDKVEEVYRNKVRDWHPDVSDDEDAEEKFKAADTARDVLLGDINFGERSEVSTAESTLKSLFDEGEIEEAARESEPSARYTSTAQKRTDPDSYSAEDFMGMSEEERSEMVQRVSLGVETTIIYQSVRGLYEKGYSKADFFNEINGYIGNNPLDEVGFNDYYKATKDSLRDGVSKELFIESVEKVQSELQNEYGEGATLREIARIISYFIVQGGVDLGIGARFVGDDRFGRDDRFSRGRRGDSRFGRDDRFDR